MKNSGKKPTKKTSILKIGGATLGGLATHIIKEQPRIL
jgi:hypothetical protein